MGCIKRILHQCHYPLIGTFFFINSQTNETGLNVFEVVSLVSMHVHLETVLNFFMTIWVECIIEKIFIAIACKQLVSIRFYYDIKT